jgi:hypothetical protein
MEPMVKSETLYENYESYGCGCKDKPNHAAAFKKNGYHARNPILKGDKAQVLTNQTVV